MIPKNRKVYYTVFDRKTNVFKGFVSHTNVDKVKNEYKNKIKINKIKLMV
jgi:hypothetical protein